MTRSGAVGCSPAAPGRRGRSDVSGRAACGGQGLFWDTKDPYHYIRSYGHGDQAELLVGGEDHKTGQAEDTETAFARLTTYAQRLGLEKPFLAGVCVGIEAAGA